MQQLKKSVTEKKGPPGGYDSTPIPHAPPGYTVKITFHRATALPMGDAFTLSSDPYLQCELSTDLATRHKEDPGLTFRTRTLFNTTTPSWEESWVVANIPASGFKLKIRIYDEDRGDSDDRLGNVHVHVGRVNEQWDGIHESPYKIKKRMGSKRAYLLRAIAVCMQLAKEMSGRLYISVEVLERTPGEEGGRAYTIGPQYWCRHYSPLLGRLVGSKTNKTEDDDDEPDENIRKTEEEKTEGTREARSMPASVRIPGTVLLHTKTRKKLTNTSVYNFQANQIQLQGPVPPELYHRYVEFRPFIKQLFTASGLRGILLQKALHHQHGQVYNFNRETRYGVFTEGPCKALTRRFLDLCQHGEGGRMFTYVITLDALMRFTETGKEFGIDLLSKHSMHSDACNYIAYSGEFFIRQRQKKPRKKNRSADQADKTSDFSKSPLPSPDANRASKTSQNPNQTQSPKLNTTTPSAATTERSTFSDTIPSNYELIIDNDSGTYRPSATLLPLLQTFLSTNFPGLKVITLDCVADAELMHRLKTEQREKKREANKKNGRIVYTQLSGSSSSSLGSSVEERLDRAAEEAMVEDRYRAEEMQGSGEGRVEQVDQDEVFEMEKEEEREEERKVEDRGAEDGQPPSYMPQPKSKLAEAALPFVKSEKAREALTEKIGERGRKA